SIKQSSPSRLLRPGNQTRALRGWLAASPSVGAGTIALIVAIASTDLRIRGLAAASIFGLISVILFFSARARVFMACQTLRRESPGEAASPEDLVDSAGPE